VERSLIHPTPIIGDEGRERERESGRERERERVGERERERERDYRKAARQPVYSRYDKTNHLENSHS
jgi:hypothetical protein